MSDVCGIPVRIPVEESKVHQDGLFPIENTSVVPETVETLAVGTNPGSYV